MLLKNSMKLNNKPNMKQIQQRKYTRLKNYQIRNNKKRLTKALHNIFIKLELNYLIILYLKCSYLSYYSSGLVFQDFLNKNKTDVYYMELVVVTRTLKQKIVTTIHLSPKHILAKH